MSEEKQLYIVPMSTQPFPPIFQGLNRDLQSSQTALDDLRGTVVMVETRRDDFNHIDEVYT